MMSSNLERKIHYILEDNDIPFAEEYEFSDLIASSGRPLRFDFAVFDDMGDLDFLIEAQGIQHYQARPSFGGARGLYRQQYNEQRKKRYCLEHNINLITIPYYDEPILSYDYIMRLAGYSF